MINDYFKSRINLVESHKNPLRLLMAFALRKMRLSRYFTIDKCHYRLRFYPSALLMHYWADKNARAGEEIFLNRLLKIDSTVLDIGANVGTLSIPMALHVGRGGTVVAVEANPTTFQYLKGNIEFNKITNISTFNCAVGEKEGELCFSNISSDDMNRVVKDGSEGTIRVPVRTIDSIVQELGFNSIRLIKIDVEGYELPALKGAAKALKMCDIIFFESWDEHFLNYSYTTKDLLEYLEDFGFHIYRFEEDRLKRVEKGYHSKTCENLIAFKDEKTNDCIYEKK